MSLLKAISNELLSGSGSGSSSFYNATSSSSSFHPSESTNSEEAAVVFTIFLILALLISILVSSINFFKSVKYTQKKYIFFYFTQFFSQWMHESLAILIMGTLVGCIQNFLVNTHQINSNQSILNESKQNYIFI